MAVMTFEEWLNYKALVLGGAPAWFEDPAECERRYAGYAEAFEDNCTATDPRDAAFRTPIPAYVIGTVETGRVQPSRIARPAVVRLWTIAFALLVQLAVVAGPAFAGENGVTMNGEALSAQQRATLEAIVGPLEPGGYWARDNGDFGRQDSEMPIANLQSIMQQRIQAARLAWLKQQHQQALRNQMMSQMLQNAWRQRQAQGGYIYGNNFSSGQRYGNGSWSHYNGYSNYGVGGTSDGCIYTPNWSNC